MSQLANTLEQQQPLVADFLPLNGTDHIELYVGNAKQSAYSTKRHLVMN